MHAVLVAPGTLEPGAGLALDPEEQHHLKVRRAKEGERVRVLDGEGGVAEGRLLAARDGFEVAVEALRRVPPPPGFILVVGAGDKERFGWLAEKAAELGVTDLVPLKTERTRSVAAGIREGHVHALQRRARQAIKQSGAPWAPRVIAPIDVRTAAAQGVGDFRWLADPTGEPPPSLPAEAPLVVVVGPEGGFLPPEREAFLTAGFHRVRLAPDLLRFETAALAAAAVIASQRPRRPHEQ
jgi:16S rRNA (uracil1498-N3)-methyltransferase